MKDYFTDAEKNCNCGCGEANIEPNFLRKLNECRDLAGVPFIPSSFCRCEKHNKVEGGRETSSHISNKKKKIFCKGVDVKATDSTKRFKIINAAIKVGFKRIGIAKDFIHLDDDKTKKDGVVWLY